MEKTEGSDEIVEVKAESHCAPIAKWRGTLEMGYASAHNWSIRLYDTYVSVTVPQISFTGRTKTDEVRYQIVYETRRYYGPLHRALMDLYLSDDGTEDLDAEAINLFSQHYRTE